MADEIAKLVRAAYDEGFSDGCTVEAGEAGMPHWEDTRAYRDLNLLAGPKPIETAPKDGEYLWLGKPGFVRIGYWDNGWMDVSGQGPLTIEPTHWARPVPPDFRFDHA